MSVIAFNLICRSLNPMATVSSREEPSAVATRVACLEPPPVSSSSGRRGRSRRPSFAKLSHVNRLFICGRPFNFLAFRFLTPPLFPRPRPLRLRSFFYSIASATMYPMAAATKIVAPNDSPNSTMVHRPRTLLLFEDYRIAVTTLRSSSVALVLIVFGLVLLCRIKFGGKWLAKETIRQNAAVSYVAEQLALQRI